MVRVDITKHVNLFKSCWEKRKSNSWKCPVEALHISKNQDKLRKQKNLKLQPLQIISSNQMNTLEPGSL